MADMTTETPTATEPGQDLSVEQKISQLRELFADAPEVGKTALGNVLRGGEYFFLPSPSALRWLADLR
jgi:hypothetical protein